MEQNKKAADFIENAKQESSIKRKTLLIGGGAVAVGTGIYWINWIHKKHTENPEAWETVYALTGLGIIVSGIGVSCYVIKKLYDLTGYDSLADDSLTNDA